VIIPGCLVAFPRNVGLRLRTFTYSFTSVNLYKYFCSHESGDRLHIVYAYVNYLT